MIRQFIEEEIQKGDKHIKSSSNSLVIRNVQIDQQWDIALHFLLSKKKKVRKLDIAKCC